MERVMYPGSFCPFTLGHADIVERARKISNLVIIAIMNNTSKPEQMFSIEERLDMLKELYSQDISKGHIKVISSEEATVDCAYRHKCMHIIRGLRGLTDFDIESQMAFTNRDLSNNSLDTIFLVTSLEHTYTSSSNVRERIKYNKSIENLVPNVIYDKIRQKYINL